MQAIIFGLQMAEIMLVSFAFVAKIAYLIMIIIVI